MALARDRNIDRANDLFRVSEKEVALRILPLKPPEDIRGVVALIAIQNVSDRRLTLFEARIAEISRSSSSTPTEVKYDIICSVRGASWCRALAPGEALYHSVLLDIEAG